MLLAREVTQESIGFNPKKLVFGHTVRDPLSLLRNGFKEAEPPQNILDSVNNFHYRLCAAGELARQKFAAAQCKMKTWYDQQAECRVYLMWETRRWLLPTRLFKPNLLTHTKC